jgi:hypothetical protein
MRVDLRAVLRSHVAKAVVDVYSLVLDERASFTEVLRDDVVSLQDRRNRTAAAPHTTIFATSLQSNLCDTQRNCNNGIALNACLNVHAI